MLLFAGLSGCAARMESVVLPDMPEAGVWRRLGQPDMLAEHSGDVGRFYVPGARNECWVLDSRESFYFDRDLVVECRNGVVRHTRRATESDARLFKRLREDVAAVNLELVGLDSPQVLERLGPPLVLLESDKHVGRVTKWKARIDYSVEKAMWYYSFPERVVCFERGLVADARPISQVERDGPLRHYDPWRSDRLESTRP